MSELEDSGFPGRKEESGRFCVSPLTTVEDLFSCFQTFPIERACLTEGCSSTAVAYSSGAPTFVIHSVVTISSVKGWRMGRIMRLRRNERGDHLKPGVFALKKPKGGITWQ
jgi:hypothetical protein